MITFTLALQLVLSFTTIARGETSGLDAAREVVVRSAEEWRLLWNEHQPARPMPVVDFQTDTVIGVFLGSRPTAGFAVEIAAVRSEGDELVVEVREERPPPGAVAAQVVTFPFHLIRVPRHDGTIRFTRVVASP